MGGDRVEFDLPPEVTIVRDSTGEEIISADDTEPGDDDSTFFKYTVPAIDSPDELIATWEGEIDGQPAQVETRHEVLGGHIVGVPWIKSELERIKQTPLSSDEEIAEKRDLAEKRIEGACRVAFRPRYSRATVAGTGRTTLLLPTPRLLEVLSINGETFEAAENIAGEINRSQGWTGDFDIAWIHGYQVAPASVAAAVRQLAIHYLMVDPDDLDGRATFKSNEIASWSLVTPGVRGAHFPIPEVNEVVNEFGYPGAVG